MINEYAVKDDEPDDHLLYVATGNIVFYSNSAAAPLPISHYSNSKETTYQLNVSILK
jgi:hypothetical protein